MPRYDFICNICNYKEERYVSINYPKLSKCPQCDIKNSFIRCISKGSGFILKGDGFYVNRKEE